VSRLTELAGRWWPWVVVALAVLTTAAAPALIVLTAPALLGSLLALSGRRGLRQIGAVLVVLAASGGLSLLLVFGDMSGATRPSPTPAASSQL